MDSVGENHEMQQRRVRDVLAQNDVLEPCSTHQRLAWEGG